MESLHVRKRNMSTQYTHMYLYRYINNNKITIQQSESKLSATHYWFLTDYEPFKIDLIERFFFLIFVCFYHVLRFAFIRFLFYQKFLTAANLKIGFRRFK